MGIAFLGRWLRRSGRPALSSTAQQRPTAPEDAESQFNLGRKCAEGNGAVPDYAQAVEWYLKAAGQGHCMAQFNLGLMYGQGQGVPRDEATAWMWLRKAAELGHAGAQYHLGVRQHRASKSGPQSEASECRIESFKWLQLAKAQDYRGAKSAWEFVVLGMTQEEVDEGRRRAAAFTVSQAKQGTAAG